MHRTFIQDFPHRFPRVHRWGGRLLALVVGQSVLQALNLLIGFLLIRWLSMDSYAQLGVVFGFQATLGMLVDLGFSNCIVALVGNRGDKREVIGGYIAGAHWFRARLFVTLIPLAGAAFYWIGTKHGWDFPSQALLFVGIVVALYSQGRMTWYSAPLVIHHRIGQLYRVQNVGAVGRLLASVLLHLTGWLSAVTVTAINTGALIWTAVNYTKEARPYVDVPAHSTREVRREMMRYLAPIIPVIAFTAVQSQILVFLISIFGKTQSISEVAALGRLGQIFIVLGAINTTLIEPYFSRVHRDQLLRRYLQAVGAAIVAGGGLAAMASYYPGPLLWLLGSKYEHLDLELSWMMAAASVGFVGSVMWTIHSARKWVYWWGSALYIAAVTALQIGFILCMDLNTTLSVLYLGFATSLTVLIVHGVTAVICFSGEHRRGRQPPPDLAATSL